MNATLNILSIDFTFFQDVDVDTLKNQYPDSIDVSTLLSQIAWAARYQTDADKILSVKTNADKLHEIQDILTKCRANIPVMVSRSHKDIYEFIHEGARVKKTSKVDITNVDLHHDMFNDNYVIDCGNWLKFVAEDFDANITWIANPVSKECYGLTGREFSNIGIDLSIIEPEKVDAVFLCRSDAWLPPHLDPHFLELINVMRGHFRDIYIDKDVERPREITNAAI